jgi:hypothetical protein
MLRAIAVSLTLFALYWLTVSGAFHSIDEEAVFAVARNVALYGEANQNTLYRAVPYIDQAKVGIDGAFYSKYGIGHALALAPVVWLAQGIPGATLASSAMLVNALATAATGGLLVFVALRLGYSERTGVLLGLVYGSATFAWIYAKTMFSEPLVGFWWLLAVYVLLTNISWRRALLSGVCLAIALSIRPASILVTPLFALLLLQRAWKPLFIHLVVWGIPIAIVGMGLLWFNQLRFGNLLNFGYSEGFDGNLFIGLQGFLFSFDRSLFLFAPPLLLLVIGVPPFLRRHARVGYTILAVGVASLLMYSAWAVFWGGPVWGPRYLIPTLPLWFILLAPTIEKAVGVNSLKRWQLAVGSVSLAGIVMQLPGVLWNSLPMTQELGQRHPLWTLLPRAEWQDIAWAATPEGFVLSGILLAVAIVALIRPRLAWVGSAMIASSIGSVMLLGYLGESNFGYQWGSEEQAIVEHFATEARPDDALILNFAPYQEPLPRLIGWMNRPRPPATLYGILRDVEANPAVTESELTYLLSRHERLWLLTEGVAPGDSNSVTELALSRHAAPIHTEWVNDTMRLTLFERLNIATRQGAPNATFGDMVTLRSWSIAKAPESIQVTLEWEPLCGDTRDLHTFVQVLDGNGQLVVGWDNVPQFGFAPATTWQSGVPFREQMALSLPAGFGWDRAQVIVGMVDTTTGERLTTDGGADFVVLQ